MNESTATLDGVFQRGDRLLTLQLLTEWIAKNAHPFAAGAWVRLLLNSGDWPFTATPQELFAAAGHCSEVFDADEEGTDK